MKFLSALVGCSLFSLTVRAAPEVPWALEEHPYRAVVRLKDAPKFPETGIRIDIPQFGDVPLTNPTITLTDKKGQTLPANVIWHENGVNLLLLAQTMEKGSDYYVYFGGASVRPSPGWQARPSLLLETRRAPANAKLDTPQEMEDTWKRATQLDGMGFVPSIFQGENPYGESSNYLSKYTGYLVTGKAETLHLFTVSSDASFVYVNGKYKLGWPGTHTSRTTDRSGPNKKVQASPGQTKIEYYHAKTSGGAPATGLLWKGTARRPEPIPASQWVHPGTADVVRLEGAHDRPVPFPRLKILSYIGHNDVWLFETTCSIDSPRLEGWTVTWRFSDGATLTGVACSRVIPGLLPVKVLLTLQKGNERLTGVREISFASSDIPQASISVKTDLVRYFTLLGRETPSHLTPRTLELDLKFLRAFAGEPQVAPFAEALLLKISPNDPQWLQSQLTRIHAMAQTDPARALAELRKIDPATRKLHAKEFDMLEVDLLVFYLRDPQGADIAKQFASQHKEPGAARLFRTRAGDSYRIQGRYKEAVAGYQSAQKSIVEGSAGRKLPTQDRAFSMTIDQLMNDGFRKEASQKLAEWESIHPMAKLNSDFLLLRTRLLILLGRWKEALMEIESFEKMQPDSPYQIEGDFYRARALFQTGQKAEAKKIWTEIATKYPKHEFAAQSKEWARQ